MAKSASGGGQLKQRKSTAVASSSSDVGESTSDSSGTPNSSSADLPSMEKRERFMSLEERSAIPLSMYMIYGIIGILHYSVGFYSLDTLERWSSAMATSAKTFAGLMGYVGGLATTATTEDAAEWSEYARAAILSILIASLLWVFVGAPLRAGFWTGRRTSRHRIHRYAGLLYLAQYMAAWIEYFTDYGETGAINSVLPHCIALNGIIQGTSAYYSFRVLPALSDAGYYSDKAVLSRKFVHENLYYTLLSVLGSVYYYPDLRAGLQSTLPGRVVEFIFIFCPYIVLRQAFPRTQFSMSNATNQANQTFYRIGTLTIKIFYLWAKYFLGFFVNYLVYMDLVKEDEFRVIRGLFLLNLGTVSLAVFLHTLRFKKVLPAKLTFSIYLVQLYLTFLGIPMVLKMFAAHPNLCILCTAGILSNMLRSLKVHALWCAIATVLITQTNIEW